MLRWNGLYVERRKMCPNNPLNNQHSSLDLSWQVEGHDTHEHHTLEQRKQRQKELVAKIYQEKLQEVEGRLTKGMSSNETARIMDEQLERHLQEFNHSRLLHKPQAEQSPRAAQLRPLLPQYSHVQNIMYQPHANYRLGSSTLLHPPP